MACFNPFALGLGAAMFSDNDRPTLWNKLTKMCQYSSLAISANVETATMIPFMPVINSTWMNISTSEFGSVQVNARIPRLLRGVVLLPNSPTLYGVPAQQNVQHAIGSGYYDVAQEFPDVHAAGGRFHIAQSPPWLSGSQFTGWAEMQVPTALHKNNMGKASAVQYGNIYNEQATFLNEYAKALYMCMVFGSRGAEVTSRLRFDLAPGSMIQINGASPELDAAGYSSSTNRASVMSVTTNISTRRKSCGVALRLGHIRSKDDFELSVANHPMYSSYWRGSPMVNLPGVTPAVTL
jgi:hypothetical protein